MGGWGRTRGGQLGVPRWIAVGGVYLGGYAMFHLIRLAMLGTSGLSEGMPAVWSQARTIPDVSPHRGRCGQLLTQGHRQRRRGSTWLRRRGRAGSHGIPPKPAVGASIPPQRLQSVPPQHPAAVRRAVSRSYARSRRRRRAIEPTSTGRAGTAPSSQVQSRASPSLPSCRVGSMSAAQSSAPKE